jgi:hypothetical protein
MTAICLRLAREASKCVLVSSAAENVTRNMRSYETDPTHETYIGLERRYTHDLRFAIF